MEIHHKQFFNGINLNGNTFSRIGNIGAIDSAGSLKYDNGALCYHNGTSWVSLGGGAKYMGELPEAILPQGAQDGEVYRVMSDTHDQIYSSAAFASGTWRTFTKQEIAYIIANYRHTFGKIGNVNGMFIIPNGVETTLTINNMTYSTNTVTVEQWESMTAQGIVFLPRTDIWTNTTSPTTPSTKTAYWSGSIHSDHWSGLALCWIDSHSDTVSQIIPNDDWWGTWSLAVRLVREVDASDTTSFATSDDTDATHIKFADANLIYKQGYGFMFAKSVYDVYNKYGSPTETGWFDAFMYGTSGYVYQPWSKSGGKSTVTTNISSTNHDWGTYNQIGGWTEGVYPAGSAFVVDDGELVPLCAGVPLDIYTQLPNIAEKTDKVSGATNGNFAVLDASGNLMDSGVNPTDISGNSNYTIHAPLAAMTTDTPILLGTEFGDIADAIEQGKNPIVVFAQQDSTDTFIFAKINDYVRMSMAQIPDGQGGTIIPTDAISFYTTLNVIGTATSWFIIFVNPSDNETYIYHDTVSLPNILWDNDSAIYQAWGDNDEKAIDVKIDGVTIKKQNDGTLYSEGAGVNYLLTVYPTDLHTQNEEIWIPNQVTRTELLFDTVEAQYISGKVPTAVYAVVNGDGTDQQRIGLSLTDFEYHGRQISLDRYYQMDLHYGEIQTKGAFIFKSNKMFDTPLERMVMYLYKGVDDNTYIYMGIENGAVMDIQYEGTWSSSYDPTTSAYAYGMNTIKVAHWQFNLQQEPNSGVDAINRIYQLAIQYKNSSFRFIYGNEEVISNTYYITLNNDIITVYINEWDSQQQAFVQKSAEAPLQALATATN